MILLVFYILTSYNVNSCKEGLMSPDIGEDPDLIEDPEPVVVDKPAALSGKFLFNDMFDFNLNNQLVKLNQFFFG